MAIPNVWFSLMSVCAAVAAVGAVVVATPDMVGRGDEGLLEEGQREKEGLEGDGSLSAWTNKPLLLDTL